MGHPPESPPEVMEPIPFARWRTDPGGFADALGQSLVETGFAVVEGHPLPDALVGRVERVAQAFFALPTPSKLALVPRGSNQGGYTPLGRESAKGEIRPDAKEFWHTRREGTPRVAAVPDFDASTAQLFGAMEQFGHTLLEAVALFLGLERSHFAPLVRGGSSVLRLLRYPPVADAPPGAVMRAGAHEDINTLTLLLGTQEAGLQIQTRAGAWLDVNPEPGAVVVNVGDMLQRYTGGLLPSTTHRVRNPAPGRAAHARYSLPFFLHFRGDVELRVPPSLRARGGRQGEVVTAGDYLAERLREIGLA